MKRVNLTPFCLMLILSALLLPSGILKAQKAQDTPPARVLRSENFNTGKMEGWSAYGASVAVNSFEGKPALETQGSSQIFWGVPGDNSKRLKDVTIEGDVAVERNNASAGFLLRADKQGSDNMGSGYWTCLRKLDSGYAIVQLYRFPEYALLQEARARVTVNLNQPVPLKVTCNGPHIWVWAGDMRVPAITEFDDKCGGAGFVGLKAEDNKARFANIVISAGGKTPRAPYVHDWSWIKGAVFITSESVNSYQMWEEYHPEVVDRELGYARSIGLNTVQVYLNFLCWQKYGLTYLTRIEDFLQKADRRGLKTTLILFDDVGSVEPPHLAPYAAPVPGVHNSQMQGSPGRDIVDNRYAEYRAQLKAYVQGVVKAHKNDTRILFWQTYNEPSHATTLPLLADAYAWIKEAGSAIPVTATGGGAFYGSYYSDFPSFHSYLDPKAPPAQNMVLGDGGPEHVCTETLDRPGVDVPKLVNYFAARKTGWVIWELMIGRDNCRFPWGSPQGAAEPATPFHGLLYPDGHPWSQEDTRSIRGVLP